MTDHQRDLFSKKGLPGQMNLFADVGVPDDMVGDQSIPAALADSRAIGERTEAGREQNRIDRQRSREDYSGAFDGFVVTSDADSGL